MESGGLVKSLAIFLFVCGLITTAAKAAEPNPLEGRLELGLEYDSNVFTMEDDTAADLSDSRKTLKGRLEGRLPQSSRYRLTPRYDIYGYWYNNQSHYDLLVQRVSLRLDDDKPPRQPRLQYTFTYGMFGRNAYEASHRVAGRLTLTQAGEQRVWLGAHVELNEAPGSRYEYLSGTELQLALTGFDTLREKGWLYGGVELHYKDRGTNNTTFGGAPVMIEYSYVALEPFLFAEKPVTQELTLSGGVRYEYRSYENSDIWGGATPGSKRRQDNKFTATISVSRPVWESATLIASYKGQIRSSNIGDDPNDYRDRDYTRHIYGIFIKAEF